MERPETAEPIRLLAPTESPPPRTPAKQEGTTLTYPKIRPPYDETPALCETSELVGWRTRWLLCHSRISRATETSYGVQASSTEASLSHPHQPPTTASLHMMSAFAAATWAGATNISQ